MALITPIQRLKSHVAILAYLHRECFMKAWQGADFDSFLRDSAFGWFAIENNQQCGFILGRTVGFESEILTLAVLPAYRQKGIGSTLLSKFVSVSPKPIFLEVATANKAAIKLYNNFGFKAVGIRHNYYHSNNSYGCDAYTMRLE